MISRMRQQRRKGCRAMNASPLQDREIFTRIIYLLRRFQCITGNKAPAAPTHRLIGGLVLVPLS